MAKVIIHLQDCELIALNDLAQREYCAPTVLIIRRELQKLGMIPVETPDILPVDETIQFEMKGG